MREYVAIAPFFEKKVVLQHHDRFGQHPYLWTLIGGLKESSDTILRQTASRRIGEDTGIELSFWDILFNLKEYYRDRITDCDGTSIQRTFYLLKLLGAVDLQQNAGLSIKFKSRSEIRDLGIAPLFEIPIRKAFDIAES